MMQPFKHFVPRKHKKNYTYQSKNQPEHKNLKRSKVIEYVKFLHKYSNSHNKNSTEFKDERKNFQVKYASICYSLYNELTMNSTHCSLRRDGELPVNIGQVTQCQEPEECCSLSISFAVQISSCPQSSLRNRGYVEKSCDCRYCGMRTMYACPPPWDLHPVI